MIVGERLRTIRESKQMTQRDIEQKTGLKRSYLSRCEGGHTVPSVETLEKWTRAMGISMNQLFVEDGEAARLSPALKDNQRDGAPKLSRRAAAHLRRIERAFARMELRDIAVVSALATKLAGRSTKA